MTMETPKQLLVRFMLDGKLVEYFHHTSVHDGYVHQYIDGEHRGFVCRPSEFGNIKLGFVLVREIGESTWNECSMNYEYDAQLPGPRV
jgi:hypothetical protein